MNTLLNLLFAATVLLIQSVIIYCLWDDVMVKFFNVQDVTFWDSLLISILAGTLFKSYVSLKSE